MILLPYKSQYKPKGIPIVIPLLVVANVLIFVYQELLPYLGRGENSDEAFVQSMAVIPYNLIRLRDVTDWFMRPFGALATLVTYQFCHGGIFHIVFNMLFLWVFGIAVEDRMGHIRTLLFYLTCGIGGALLHSMFNFTSQTVMIGASGSICGIMAAHMAIFPEKPIRTLFILFIFPFRFSLPSLIVVFYFFILDVLGAWVGVKSLGGVASSVAVFAHIGGFLTGLYCVQRFKGIFFPRYRG